MANTSGGVGNHVSQSGTASNDLGGELWSWFLRARTARYVTGGTEMLRRGMIHAEHTSELPPLEIEFPENFGNPSGSCGCKAEVNESCDVCAMPVDNVNVAETFKKCGPKSVFDDMATLLTNVKLAEFTAAVENAYAPIGNKPHQLKARHKSALPKDEIKKAAKAFYAYLKDFLETNQVRVNELPEAFDVSILQDVRKALVDAIRASTEDLSDKALSELDQIIESTFHRTNFMGEYQKAVDDTKHYPLGVVWCDGAALSKKRKLGANKKLKVEWDVQATAKRIDPRYFWATEDWTQGQEGTMCFHLKRLTAGDIKRLGNISAMPEPIKTKINAYLEKNESGFKMHAAGLFVDESFIETDNYDVLVARGKFTRGALEELNVSIPEEMRLESHIRAEVWYSAGEVINVIVIPYPMRDLGVYTTTFRNNGDSIWGIPLYEFVWPFAVMYQATLKNIDKAVGKSVGSIISMDIGVMENIDDYIKKDPETGNYVIDFSGDTILQFDSTAAIGSPNFKGVPVHIQQMPTDLDKLLPVLRLIFEQLEIITGIPSILNDGLPGSSALRTDGLYNKAYDNASKPLKSILRRGERRILTPAIQYFFDYRASTDGLPENLVELDPYILLSDLLLTERNNDNLLWDRLERLAVWRGLIPDSKIGSLLNRLGRELGFNEDLVEGANPLGPQAPAQTPAQL